MSNYKGEIFLNKLYKNLHLEKEVVHTSLPSDSKNEKVRKYLERLEKIENLALDSNYNGLDLLKKLFYKKYVIKKENIPESYFELQKKIALERGFGHIELNDKAKEELSNTLIQDQKKSLDMWLDYLISKENLYPEWFKYYVFQGMLKLGTYDKEKEAFNKRTESTTSIFIELNREALALIYDNLVKILDGNNVDDNLLQALIQNGSFSKIYSYVIKKLEQVNKDVRSNDGIWIKYNKGEDPKKLVDSLQGRGTGWCTAGYETAKTQLSNGDFYVYYTKDSNGEYKQPRIAIRMENDCIGEIRGIGSNQNLEPEMNDILEEKLKEFPDRDKYKKKVSDMEILTKIYNEYRKRELDDSEIIFLYEIGYRIDGFGYSKDPRINEILQNRQYFKDLAKVFNCSPNEVSQWKEDVLDGKAVCLYGGLNLKDLTSAEGLNLPKYILGNLNLEGLTSAEGLNLPEYIMGGLNLLNLKTSEGLHLPKYIGGFIDLGHLTTVEGLIFPKIIGNFLRLSSLTSAEGLNLPEIIGWYLDLFNLKTSKGLHLPKYIGGSLSLHRLTIADDLVLPEHIGESLHLNSLTTANGLILPKYVGENLDLSQLTQADDLVLPEYIGGTLRLDSLKSAEGLIVPENFKCGHLSSDYLSLDDLINKSKSKGIKSLQKII